jgi:putative pyruvate formate lyase activating enzyme
VDIYLPDFKYADDTLAKRYSNAPGYAVVAVNAIGEMLRQTGTATFDEDGMLQKGTIVRHLILPGCTRNSIAVLRSIERNFGKKALVSLMAQYVPAGRASEYPEINRTITQKELERVSGELERLGLDGYVQECSSADTGFIPDFEDAGVLL